MLTDQNKENEHRQDFERPKSNFKEILLLNFSIIIDQNMNNPFKTIPAPPENVLNFNRSKSNPASVDLLGLENPTQTVNENKNPADIKAAPQSKTTDPITDNIAYLLEKKESSNLFLWSKFLRNN